MTIDRYTKIVLTVIAVALVAIAGSPWLPESAPGLDSIRPAPALAQGMAPKYEVTVPKAWGKFIAFSDGNLLLEAPDQTWRIVDVEGRPPEYPKVKALIRWQ
jgi:hypothetical protein